MNRAGVELKLAGAANQSVRVPSLDSPVGDLRAEIAKSLGKTAIPYVDIVFL